MSKNWDSLSVVKPNPILGLGKNGLKNGKDSPIPTRTDKTEKAYFDFAMGAINKIYQINHCESANDVTCEDILRWVTSTRMTYRVSSWRFCRASFCNLMEREITQLMQILENTTDPLETEIIEKDISRANDVLVELGLLKWETAPSNVGKTPAQRAKELPQKTSSDKKKFVNAEILFKLDQFISGVGTEWQRRAMKLCWASLYTGLRPSEWENATMSEEDGSITLTVVNAKNTNGRACGDTRELKVSEALACKAVRDQIESVIQWKEHVKAENRGSDFADSYVTQCNNVIRTAQIQTFGESKGIAPYSFRHQFAANLKADGLSKIAIEHAMGHASIDSASHHEEKKRMDSSSIARRKADALAATMPADFEKRIMTPVAVVVGTAYRPVSH